MEVGHYLHYSIPHSFTYSSHIWSQFFMVWYGHLLTSERENTKALYER